MTGQLDAESDLRHGTSVAHEFDPERMASEAVFVPAASRPGEDEGWVMVYVYGASSDGSELAILDAADFAGQPVAPVTLPQRAPIGFHGSWIPEHGVSVAQGSRAVTSRTTPPGRRARAYTRRNLKLKRRNSNCWFGFGVHSTYFWSP